MQLLYKVAVFAFDARDLTRAMAECSNRKILVSRHYLGYLLSCDFIAYLSDTLYSPVFRVLLHSVLHKIQLFVPICMSYIEE